MIFFYRRALTGAALAAAMMGLGGPTANAVSVGDGSAPGTNATGGSVTSVVDISRQYNYVSYGKRIAYCGVGSSGGMCSISQSATVTRDIEVGASLSREVVAASLSISSITSRSVTVSCISPPMQAGQIWSAYPYGTLLTYRIRTVTTGSTTHTGWLSAFDPTGGVYCRL